MDLQLLRSWLLQQPRPALLRLTTEDGSVSEIETSQVRSWVKLAETCAAVQPVQLEALDQNKRLLRATRPDEVEAPSASTSSSSSSARALALPQTHDAETARFILFASLLADAYKHSSEVAFTKLVELYQVTVEANLATSKEVENLLRLLRREWEEKLAAAEESPEPTQLDGLMQSLATGMVQAQGGGPTNGKA